MLEIKEEHGNQVQVCMVCHHTLFINQRLTASAVVVRDGKLLVARRAIDPFKGAMDLPGGFIEANETARNGMLRELAEEMHTEGKILQIFDVLGPDPYPYEGAVHYNADTIYQVDIGTAAPQPDDDVAELIWIPIRELKPAEFAFPSHQQFIAKLQAGEYKLI